MSSVDVSCIIEAGACYEVKVGGFLCLLCCCISKVSFHRARPNSWEHFHWSVKLQGMCWCRFFTLPINLESLQENKCSSKKWVTTFVSRQHQLLFVYHDLLVWTFFLHWWSRVVNTLPSWLKNIWSWFLHTLFSANALSEQLSYLDAIGGSVMNWMHKSGTQRFILLHVNKNSTVIKYYHQVASLARSAKWRIYKR